LLPSLEYCCAVGAVHCTASLACCLHRPPLESLPVPRYDGCYASRRRKQPLQRRRPIGRKRLHNPTAQDLPWRCGRRRRPRQHAPFGATLPPRQHMCTAITCNLTKSTATCRKLSHRKTRPMLAGRRSSRAKQPKAIRPAAKTTAHGRIGDRHGVST
ncbi:unnamed protein product, partial [Ectocarpus sp. 12 AP-2014]